MYFKHHVISVWSILNSVLGILGHSQANHNTQGIIVIKYGTIFLSLERLQTLRLLNTYLFKKAANDTAPCFLCLQLFNITRMQKLFCHIEC